MRFQTEGIWTPDRDDSKKEKKKIIPIKHTCGAEMCRGIPSWHSETRKIFIFYTNYERTNEEGRVSNEITVLIRYNLVLKRIDYGEER